MNGHYFCSFCDDVKHVEYTERHIRCPDCNNHSVTWVSHNPPVQKVSHERARIKFEEIKKAIE